MPKHQRPQQGENVKPDAPGSMDDFMFEQAWNKRDDDGNYLRDLAQEIAEARRSPKYATDQAAVEAVIATMQRALELRK